MGRILDFILSPSPQTDAPAPHTVDIPTHDEWLSSSAYALTNPAAAMKIPGVFRCNVLTQDLSSQIPLAEEKRIITDNGQTRWERVATPAPIIRRPDPNVPTAEWVGDVAVALSSQGEAFLKLGSPDPATGRPTTAYVTDRNEWQVALSDNGLYPIYRWRGAIQKPYRDMIHIQYLKLPGRLHGLGPIQAYAQTLMASGNLEEWAASLFTDGGLTSVYLTTEFDMDDDEATEAKQQWMAEHQTLSPAVLSNGLKAEHAGLDPDKAQALETRMWNVQFAASAYGYNPYLLAVSMQGSSITYQTLPDLFAEAVRAVVYPDYLRKIETALTELLPRGRRARFELSEFLRADEKTRVETGVDAVNAGLYTVNEWRAREGMPPIQETQDAAPAQ